MRLLEERILADGVVRDGDVLKVDSFLNHQMDVALFAEMGKEWARLFAGEGVNKLLTIEASGIGIACAAAWQFGNLPVVFARKSESRSLTGELCSAQVESFTHGRTYNVVVERRFLGPKDRVLLIDDFLANGAALAGLVEICRQAGATVVGAGIAIEKAFQPGGQRIREMGVRVESLARIRSMDHGRLEFC